MPAHVPKCPVCGSHAPVVDARAAEWIGLRAPFGVVRCEVCGFRWQSPRPTSDELSQLYEFSYHEGTGAVDEREVPDWFADYPAPPAETRRFSDASAELVDGQIAHHLGLLPQPSRAGRSLLEIGSGRGRFLEAAKATGWTVVGVEPSRSAATTAQDAGLDVRVGTFEEVSGSLARGFDVVYLSHVLEHFSDPAVAVRVVRELVRDGGTVLAEVPNQFEAWVRRLARASRRAPRPSSLYSIHHMSFFTPSTLRRLFDDAGFETAVRSDSPIDRRSARGLTVGAVDRAASRLASEGSYLQAIAIAS